MHNEIKDFDSVTLVKASLCGNLHALATREGWDVQDAARNMGASLRNAESLLNRHFSDLPLETLFDMAESAGIEVELGIKLPKRTPGRNG